MPPGAAPGVNNARAAVVNARAGVPPPHAAPAAPVPRYSHVAPLAVDARCRLQAAAVRVLGVGGELPVCWPAAMQPPLLRVAQTRDGPPGSPRHGAAPPAAAPPRVWRAAAAAPARAAPPSARRPTSRRPPRPPPALVWALASPAAIGRLPSQPPRRPRRPPGRAHARAAARRARRAAAAAARRAPESPPPRRGWGAPPTESTTPAVPPPGRVGCGRRPPRALPRRVARRPPVSRGRRRRRGAVGRTHTPANGQAPYGLAAPPAYVASCASTPRPPTPPTRAPPASAHPSLVAGPSAAAGADAAAAAATAPRRADGTTQGRRVAAGSATHHRPTHRRVNTRTAAARAGDATSR